MRALIACALLVVASAQLFPWWNGGSSDRHNGYYFQYHSRHNVMVVRDNKNCYLFKGSADVVHKYHDKSSRDALEAQVMPYLEGRERDRHAGYTFEYFSTAHVLLIRDVYFCYLLHTTYEIEKRFYNIQTRSTLEDNLIKQIKDRQNMFLKTEGGVLRAFKDIDVDLECRHRTIYELVYQP
ncbi:hypothetical protein LOTGIDRAFT_237040 [Lottia gigantea]|uniref:Uncharacterized protein n=1 Tax=Lottia gigantea TaxID=225164 RepID=V4B1Y5_LOTGI|nr:hypothetical protein LOTGIDRAFT_237040 [Lottia gigantea]ESO82309.1 hypothetical protein LOTGIDRAFT_237040 [Lottia gigantea]